MVGVAGIIVRRWWWAWQNQLQQAMYKCDWIINKDDEARFNKEQVDVLSCKSRSISVRNM